MKNIFFFIKHILNRNSPYLICFIVFDLFPREDMFHFRKSICESPFIDNEKKDVLKKIYFDAIFCRYKLKRFIYHYRCKKMNNADITTDLYKTSLDIFLPKYKISLIQNNTIFNFRLTDLLTMWIKALKHSDGLFSDPLYLKNPYTGQRFKKHNLYNIYFALLDSHFHIPPLISYFFLLEFDMGEFSIIHYSLLQDIAITNYHRNMPVDEKFLDIIEMLDNYGNKDILLDPLSSKEKKLCIINKLDSLLLYYYYAEYSQNSRLKDINKKKLTNDITHFFSTNYHSSLNLLVV